MVKSIQILGDSECSDVVTYLGDLRLQLIGWDQRFAANWRLCYIYWMN